MKYLLFISLLLLLTITPAFGQFLSDRTGLATSFDVDTSGHTFEVRIVSNFDVVDHEFDKDEKRLTIFMNSSLEHNLGEVTIPKTLLGGNFTFYVNDIEYNQKTKSNEKISFVTLNFTGTGNNKIDIVGTEALIGVKESQETIVDESTSEGGGCLIATATFGSELSPQVQQLRELRDNQLLQTESGNNFMNLFNDFYYSFSPIIADYERENLVFKEAVKIAITPLLSSLSIMQYAESESEVLGIGVGVILLNGMMYVGIPAIVIVEIRKRF